MSHFVLRIIEAEVGLRGTLLSHITARLHLIIHLSFKLLFFKSRFIVIGTTCTVSDAS